MAKEIERKFLVDTAKLPSPPDSSHRFVQCYISRQPGATVRLRIIDECEARLTIKGRNHGIVRDEWEYPIPYADAREMLASLPVSMLIEKTRLCIGPWEVDLFHGRLEGLAVAEIELPAPEATFERPAWLGEEVTGDPRYYNSSLCQLGSPAELG